MRIRHKLSHRLFNIKDLFTFRITDYLQLYGYSWHKWGAKSIHRMTRSQKCSLVVLRTTSVKAKDEKILNPNNGPPEWIFLNQKGLEINGWHSQMPKMLPCEMTRLASYWPKINEFRFRTMRPRDGDSRLKWDETLNFGRSYLKNV